MSDKLQVVVFSNYNDIHALAVHLEALLVAQRQTEVYRTLRHKFWNLEIAEHLIASHQF